MRIEYLLAASVVALATLGSSASARAAGTSGDICVACLQVRVGTPVVVRGPFRDELDAPFTALKLADGSFRGFSANGTTYAIDSPSLSDMKGQRQAVLRPGARGSLSECGRWLTSTARLGEELVGLVHQERDCDYKQGRTDKSMAIATSADDGLTWTDPVTIITGRDSAQKTGITGEGDCTLVDGHDTYLYAYCLRNSDSQTIVARARAGDLTHWTKYFEGAWAEPGLGGRATAIGFLGPGAGYVTDPGGVATVTDDPWFGGVRLSLSKDMVSFVDIKEPLVTIDGSDWNRPAKTDLIAYLNVMDPDTGSNDVSPGHFLLAYIYIPPGKGFESRYLVEQDVSLTLEDQPPAVQAGMALTRWTAPGGDGYVTSTGPLTGDRLGYRVDKVVAYLLTRAPDGAPSSKIAECSSKQSGHLDQALAPSGTCESEGYVTDRTAGWLYATQQPGTVPVYRCLDSSAGTHFASSAADCEGLGTNELLLGYGLAS